MRIYGLFVKDFFRKLRIRLQEYRIAGILRQVSSGLFEPLCWFRKAYKERAARARPELKK